MFVMGMFSKITTRIRYKKSMKQMSKRMADCMKMMAKNEKRIQELQDLIQADARA